MQSHGGVSARSKTEHVVFGKETVPTRSCVVCRSRGEQSQFLRFVRKQVESSYVIEPDPMRVGYGRGAYVCLGQRCLTEPKLPSLLWRQLGRKFESALKMQSGLKLQVAVQAGLRELEGPGKSRATARNVLNLVASFLEAAEPQGSKKKGIRL